jgi:hypothetical protein
VNECPATPLVVPSGRCSDFSGRAVSRLAIIELGFIGIVSPVFFDYDSLIDLAAGIAKKVQINCVTGAAASVLDNMGAGGDQAIVRCQKSGTNGVTVRVQDGDCAEAEVHLGIWGAGFFPGQGDLKMPFHGGGAQNDIGFGAEFDAEFHLDLAG